MIVNGNSYCNAAFWSKHLLRVDTNERVSVEEMRGLSSRNVRDALYEMQAIAGGAGVKNGFYMVSLNTPAGEPLTTEQWRFAADRVERELGLEGQARFIVEHTKEGADGELRTHRHVCWSRIDVDQMRAISDSHNYRKHEIAARDIERELGLTPVEGVHIRDKETVERPERRPDNWETFRAMDSAIDPQQLKREVTALWHEADSGQAFKAALEEAGYILARGDRRDFIIVDAHGDEHSLARRTGTKAADVRERMADVDKASLPSVEEARERAREAYEASGGAGQQPQAQEPPKPVPEPQSGAITELRPEPPAEQVLRPEPQANDEGLRPEPEFTGEPEEPHRSSPWGRAWRAFSDAARAAATQFAQYVRDEASGTPEDERGPWQRLIGAGRKMLGGYFYHDGERLAEAMEEAKALAIQEALRRLDAAASPDEHDTHHPPDEHHREPSRHGAQVDAPEPDEAPQEAAPAGEEGLDPFAFMDEWQAGYGAEDAADEQPDTPESEEPEPDGIDIEP